MTIILALEKKEKILNLCHEILKEDVVTIRILSKLKGYLVAAFPAVALGPFYYRALEMDKAKTKCPMKTMMPRLNCPMKRRRNFAAG